MIKKRFLYPWQKKYIIDCPKCGSRTETRPLWFWEKEPENLAKLQPNFCHLLDSEFLEKIPVLTENDWKSKQKFDAFCKEFTDDSGNRKSLEEMRSLVTIDDGLVRIFRKHGIFALIRFFNETELKALFLFLSLERERYPRQIFLMEGMEISRSHVSAIMKKFWNWRLIVAIKGFGKGRARGRQLIYAWNPEARKILEQDLKEYDFFHSAVFQTMTTVAEKFPSHVWRKDFFGVV